MPKCTSTCAHVVVDLIYVKNLMPHYKIYADLTALRCWACFLTLKKKVKDEPKDFVDIPFVLWDRPVSYVFLSSLY